MWIIFTSTSLIRGQRNDIKKRRILKTKFIELLVRKLRPGGTLCIATDQIDYAEEIVENLKPVAALKSVYNTIYIQELDDYIPTKYYRKFVPELGVHFSD